MVSRYNPPVGIIQWGDWPWSGGLECRGEGRYRSLMIPTNLAPDPATSERLRRWLSEEGLDPAYEARAFDAALASAREQAGREKTGDAYEATFKKVFRERYNALRGGQTPRPG